MERGQAGLDSIVAEGVDPSTVELVQCDTADDASCAAAAAAISEKGVTLYGLVNNAGCGLAQDGDFNVDLMLNTNFLGPKRVSEAFLPLLDTSVGRIVNVSSGAASMWLRNQTPEAKALFSNSDITWEQLDEAVKTYAVLPATTESGFGGYGLSKAALTAFTMIQAKQNPGLTISSISPGFIATAMTKGYGAKLTPDQGTVAIKKCLFDDVTSGFYYGSDGLRSPLTCTRDPGTPEYQGEAEPDASVYNKSSALG